tara:strand:+ start:1237 stop:2016 length:780 start_codon:yes stop_codon:yes gene_type:complete
MTKSDEMDERIRDWQRRSAPFLVVAALAPLGPTLSDGDPTSGPNPAIYILSWLVFAVDFTVRYRNQHAMLARWRGRFHLVVVLLTFPIYIFVPSLEDADVLIFGLTGWVVALALAGLQTARNASRMLRRVGVAVFYGGAVVITSAIIVNRVEDADSGFETFGDSVWWSIVTITTVGYGDTVPETGVGRVIAAFLMLAGLAILGVLAASLASYFGLEDAEKGDQEASIHDRFDELVSEVRALRAIVDAGRSLDEPKGPEN